MLFFYAFLVAAFFCAVDTVLFVLTSSPWSLGSAIFCGLLAVWNLVQGTTS